MTGVGDGSEQDNLKHVKAAIYDTSLPSITPQKQDTRTLRIPVPRPMLDAKSSAIAAAGKKADETRRQRHKLFQADLIIKILVLAPPMLVLEVIVLDNPISYVWVLMITPAITGEATSSYGDYKSTNGPCNPDQGHGSTRPSCG
ncbi:hypothetical protein EV421DRAFT_1900659 [Armillaria borealis]|uniref:Uncharacterized protein n=1 Tax=Armillaria borealis TaxID=47425 RepID=A0AA39JSA1_9AGAR|nr:hypothetical protein EV421DRAFT_1900659 [Armillaria borealis]